MKKIIINLICTTGLLLLNSCWPLSDVTYYQNSKYRSDPNSASLIVLDSFVYTRAVDGIEVRNSFLYLDQGSHNLTLFFRDATGNKSNDTNFNINIEAGKKYTIYFSIQKGGGKTFEMKEMSELDKSSQLYRRLQKAISKLE